MNDKLNEIIEFLHNYNFGEEFDCAIENHRDVLEEHNISDYDMLEIAEICGDMITTRTDLEEFIHDYYKSVIESVCKVLESYKK
jgi:hypothetical protein